MGIPIASYLSETLHSTFRIQIVAPSHNSPDIIKIDEHITLIHSKDFNNGLRIKDLKYKYRSFNTTFNGIVDVLSKQLFSNEVLEHQHRFYGIVDQMNTKIDGKTFRPLAEGTSYPRIIDRYMRSVIWKLVRDYCTNLKINNLRIM